MYIPLSVFRAALLDVLHDPTNFLEVAETIVRAASEIVEAAVFSTEWNESTLRLDKLVIRFSFDETYKYADALGFFDCGIDLFDCGLSYQKFGLDERDFYVDEAGGFTLLLPNMDYIVAEFVHIPIPGLTVIYFPFYVEVV